MNKFTIKDGMIFTNKYVVPGLFHFRVEYYLCKFSKLHPARNVFDLNSAPHKGLRMGEFAILNSFNLLSDVFAEEQEC